MPKELKDGITVDTIKAEPKRRQSAPRASASASGVTMKGALLLSPSPAAIAPASLRLVDS